ncbi:tetratricopeptide repeat protein [Tenacibaculum skagerrakense]|uniref:Tetratricopeptide repeat protein n=1 Tax=Tenacibaculum skagerrakense TaxID=186571 RepID=A0A4R2NJL2_9FLAO|nr:tetratricopeptide repeat protein [Tenacibaculum skagerrakense]TCP21314.1 tetratricopeptide repeat protein [Tenacibaculum skagerrakense]
MNVKKRNILILSGILFIGLLITYSNHFKNGFHFDDSHTIVNNVNIRSIKNIPKFFVDTKMVSSSKDHWGLRPVVTTTLAVDYWIGGGLNPFYFHLSTFIIFITLLILMFYMFRKITSEALEHKWAVYICLFAVGWYGIHTVNAETINYIISRSDVLSTFFIVISFCLYVLKPKTRKNYLYIIPAMIGVLAKETIIVLPMLLFVYVFFFEKDKSIVDFFKVKNVKTSLNLILALLPLIIGIVLVQSYTLIKTGSIAGLSNNVVHYIQTQPFVWFHYFVSFFLPFSLSGDTDWTVIPNFFDDRVIAGILFLGALIYVTVKTSLQRRTRPIAFGLLWFMFALLPTSLAPLSEVMNDHRMFFPFIGLTFSITYAIGLYVLKFEKELLNTNWKMNGVRAGIFMVLFSYAYGTYQRNKVWLNDETFWYDVTQKSPKNGRGLMNYGLTQMAKGNYPEASNYFNRALKIYPNYHTLHINLGILNSAMKNYQKSEEFFNSAIALKPNDDLPYYYYARELSKKGDLERAMIYGEKAINLNSYNLANRHLLIRTYYGLEEWTKLKDLVAETLTILPNDQVALEHKDLANNKKDRLTIMAEEAEVNPTAGKYLELSLLYYNRGMFKECIEVCEKALVLKPDFHQAYNNICSSYSSMKQYEKAIEACEKALEIAPDFVLAKNNLNYAKNQLKPQQ